DLCGVDLFLVDGIIGMEGKGPSKGEPRKVGVIISGKDPRAIDLHVARITGLDPGKLPILKAAFKDDLLYPDEELILSGDGEDLKLEPAFKPARGGQIATNPPRFLKRFMINLSTSKPRISIRNCIGCGVCRDNCAGEAIRIVKGKARIDYSRCIRCYCCHELCPHDAVYLSIKESGLARYIEDTTYRYFID
ncbi:MAG TPA: hypothetical protein ENK47_09160, partial [Euryarchaeota archaeon]|nr:hypothetical protein [Euryarchaeota archaeon]